MNEELIASPAEKPDETPSKKRTAKSKERPTCHQESERPKTANRRSPQMPQIADLLDQLRQVSGLVTLGFLSPGKANSVIRCLGKAIDTVLKCQDSGQGAAEQLEIMEACRRDPKLIALVKGLLTDDQLAELMRQTTDDEP
jgi:hypothetical protein